MLGFTLLLAAMTPAAAQAPAPAVQPASRIDANGDGRISLEEATPALKRAFPRYDVNGDGQLDAAEIARLRADVAARRGAGGEARGGAMSDARRAELRDRFRAQRASDGGRAAPRDDDGAEESIAVKAAGKAATPEEITAHVRRMALESGMADIAVIIARADGRGGWTDVVRTYTGAMTPDTLEAIASTTKWYTGATVATQVDAGTLRFDGPLTQCFPDLKAGAAAITLRQTLSHTSGIPALPPTIEARFPNLRASAANALAQPPVGPPGGQMLYTGTAFQVAARCAEVASGQDFRTLFAERIAAPLKLTRTRFGGEGRAPATGGGLGTTPAELESFTRMIAGRGQADGVRVIAEATMRDMTRLATAGVPVARIPGAARSFAGMGTGLWCEHADARGDCTSVASVGAFGTYAWVDYARSEYGVFFVRGSLPRAMPWWRGIRQALAPPPTPRTP